jgi:hypothetical protein
MGDFKKIAREMRNRLRQAITGGPLNELDRRLETLLDEFEHSIIDLADDEAGKRAKAYYEQLGYFHDGELVFDKDKTVDEAED